MSLQQLTEVLYTVQDYHKMVDVGIIKPTDRVELLNGKIYKISPISNKHSSHVKRIVKYFIKLLDDLAVVGIQDPVIVGTHSQPEPDISILKPKDNFYYNEHPKAEDVFILIEVSLATLRIDRKVKLPMYASAGIPEYWIVNLEEAIIEVYRNPVGNKYKLKEICEDDDMIELKAFNKKVKASDLLL